jgi:hypothetical protein
MKKAIKWLLGGLKVYNFAKKVEKDSQYAKGTEHYTVTLISSILAHKDELPKCLHDKSEFAMIVEVLTEILELPVSEIEGLVRKHFN